jgi:hypothetical protein
MFMSRQELSTAQKPDYEHVWNKKIKCNEIELFDRMQGRYVAKTIQTLLFRTVGYA